MTEGMFFAKAAAFIGAALCMALGSVGASIGQGLIGAQACKNLGKYPESAGKIRTVMALAMAIIESAPIYCLIISGFILYLSTLLV